MNERNAVVVVLTTVESREDADRLSKSLVEQSLVACAQVEGPITSHYRWAGSLQCAEEYRLMLKTTRAAWQKLKNKIVKMHPYDEPQIVLLHAADVSEGYRTWVTDQTT